MFRSFLFGVCALAAVAAPATAQKSKDTLRLAVNDPFANVSQYCVPAVEVGNFARRIFGTLIAFDEHSQKIVPVLAKSWKRLAPTTLEFELRDDVTFHNGNPFTAEDVITTVDFLQDPNTKIEYKTRFTWIKKIERLGPHKIRIESIEPTAMDYAQLAYRIQIQDAESFNSLKDKCDYGRLTPYGTGPLKVVSIDRNDGIVVERFDGVKGDPRYMSAPIKRIHGVPIPDRQTQVAQLMTGGIEMIQNVPADNARDLATNPNLSISMMPTGTFIYIVLDAAGRTENKALQDPRVRKALFMALDRDSLIKHIVPGGDSGASKKMMAYCLDYMTGCKYSVETPGYDLAGAKRLLAEAGYPNGLDIVYDVFTPIKAVGEAIAGELLKANIRARVNPVTIGLFYKKWSGGQSQMVSVDYPAFTLPDVGNLLDTFFAGPRDYARDPIITKAMEEGATEFDPVKRANIYEKAFNRINEMSYAMAFSSLSTVYAHSKDVEVRRNPLAAGANFITDYYWK